ncbi:hypothetical protein [Serratia liquefaciens]|uniref:Lipoprotein n=1 Tax=Serratia liquefaciens TaxID=614 RepID=A0A515D5X5_SERLI|nr:hypothetical protein [Serratia liquefaciens]QDL35814.1 hypothetical protein EGO53_29040 [Serratia liquefaciens]
MAKVILPLSLFTASIFLSACDDKSTSEKKEDELKVHVSGDKIFYSGDISEPGFKRVKDLSNTNISTLVINSRGGDIVPGMKLGELVFDKKWSIQVQDYCFSSCSNYIFPAGKTKYLSKGSQLGWHGGATQQLNENIIPKDKNDRERFIVLLTELIETESNFFKKIKVNQLSTVYGQKAINHLAILKAHNINCKGWSYSVDGLSAFGINNIVLIDGEWAPSPSYENSCIHVFDNVVIQ